MMIETLKHIDHTLLHVINIGCNNAVLDPIMVLFRNRLIWIPFYIFGGFFVLGNYKKDGWRIVLVALVLILFTDQITSTVLKPMIARLRPCNHAYGVQEIHMPMLVECGSGFSMPSSHAANHFAIAVFVGLLFYRNSRFLLAGLLFWASLVSISQVYVGVHYPLDVIAGAVLGSILAIIAVISCKFILSPSFYAPPLPAPPRRKHRRHSEEFKEYTPFDKPPGNNPTV